jgi:molecular chaperone HtpG
MARKAKKTKGKAPAGEAREFQAEVSRLLHLMVNSVYSEREVFLRELISNAADACDKLRYEAITRPDLLTDDPALRITLVADKAAGTLTVRDNGIGMSHDELIENLGTIARSGTRAFMERMTEGKGDVALIGQFGVGFYSAFIVADRVDVVSRQAGSGETWRWSSDGVSSFTVADASAEEAARVGRGTEITLILKKDATEFLEPFRLEQVVKSYSDHVALPIELVEIADGKAGEPRKLNTASALWTRPRADITDEQYREFYGHVAGSFEEPALTIHYRAEGRHEYSVLLFVPGEAPFDLFDPTRRGRVRLYVRRVFITDDAGLLPGYLRFMRGIVDSEDMPLNISREMLQNNPIVGAIRKAVTKRVLSELAKTAEKDPETYARIWTSFGAVIKEGLYEDHERRDELLGLLRFRSTTSGEALRGLKDYVGAMKENQTAIYYVTGDNAAQIAASPQIEGFRARGLEVLLLTDPVDSFWVTAALGYDGKPFKSVTQGSADLDAVPVAEEADAEAVAETADPSALGTLIAAVKQVLGDRVSDVRESQRLTSSPVCLVASETGLDRGLERILAQRGDGLPAVARVLEVNPNHPVIAALASKARSSGVSTDIEDAARLLFDQAQILEGQPVSDPAAFSARLSRLMAKGLG